MILNMMILCKSKITDLHPKPKDCSVWIHVFNIITCNYFGLVVVDGEVTVTPALVMKPKSTSIMSVCMWAEMFSFFLQARCYIQTWKLERFIFINFIHTFKRSFCAPYPYHYSKHKHAYHKPCHPVCPLQIHPWVRSQYISPRISIVSLAVYLMMMMTRIVRTMMTLVPFKEQ